MLYILKLIAPHLIVIKIYIEILIADYLLI